MSAFDPRGRPLASPSAKPEILMPSACPTCASATISTTAKHPDADSYWRCGSCGEIWNDARHAEARGGGRPWR